MPDHEPGVLTPGPVRHQALVRHAVALTDDAEELLARVEEAVDQPPPICPVDSHTVIEASRAVLGHLLLVLDELTAAARRSRRPVVAPHRVRLPPPSPPPSSFVRPSCPSVREPWHHWRRRPVR